MLTMAAIQTEMSSSETAIHRQVMRDSRAGSPRPKGKPPTESKSPASR